MRIIALITLLMTILMGVSAQNYRQLFAGFGPYLQQSGGLRDPRSNREFVPVTVLVCITVILLHARILQAGWSTGLISVVTLLTRYFIGPVLFPPGPPPNSADTSGVIVGASGYGFVPPSAGYLRYYYY